MRDLGSWTEFVVRNRIVPEHPFNPSTSYLTDVVNYFPQKHFPDGSGNGDSTISLAQCGIVSEESKGLKGT